MQRDKEVQLVTLLLPALLIFCLIGCSRVTETRNDTAAVSTPEVLPTATAEPQQVFPTPTGFVNDFAAVLDPEAKRDVEDRLSKFRKDQNVDFAIVTVSTTAPKSIDDYSLEMTREWKVGAENGGLLLLLSIDDRAWRIQIDRKLENVITNDEVKEIGEVMVEDLKRKDYASGLRKLADRMIASLSKKLGKQPIKE